MYRDTPVTRDVADDVTPELLLQIARRGYVMESGAITLSGAAGELLGSDAVQRAYPGG
ncbi:MAG: hypothetical protein NUV63_14495 [Gallionella sp.]|nr:hypothetical protein [Gallionella sp.]